jgi:DNA-binding LacI/PurR family transcriptional regulator
MSDSELKHRRISQLLRHAIVSGQYAVGARLPSEAQLVARHQVSRPTVIRALNDLVSAGLVERRMGSGSYVRQATTGADSSRRLGLLMPGFGRTEIFERIRGELATAARTHGFSLLWGGPEQPGHDAGLTPAQAREVCAQFVAQRVDGVFFAPFELVPGREEANRQIAESLRLAGVPVILLDRDLGPFPKRSDFDLVGIDNMAAGYLLAEHVLKLGCERIAFVARPDSASTVDARINGVRAAIANHGDRGRSALDPPGRPGGRAVRAEAHGRPALGRPALRQRPHGRGTPRDPDPRGTPRARGRPARRVRRRALRNPALHAADHHPPALPGYRRRGAAGHARPDLGPLAAGA